MSKRDLYIKAGSGGTATAVLIDTATPIPNILSTTPIASGATENITAPDGTVENSTGSYSDTVVSGGTLVLPDETINIVDEDGNTIDSITFPVYTDPNIDITSYCPLPPDATAVLKDTDGSILSTTDIPAGTSNDITAPDGTVTVNRDGVFFADVPVASGGTATVNVPSLCEPDFDAENFITQAAITNSTQQSLIRTLVSDLKTQGLWAKLQVIYPMIGGTALAHRFNLRNAQDSNGAFRLTFFGGWTHAATGALPNGTNGYADTYFRFDVLSSLTSFHLMVNVRNINSGTSRVHAGCASGTQLNSTLLGRVTGGTREVGTIGGRDPDFSPSTTVSPFVGSKIITTNNNRVANYYANGVLQSGSVTQTQGSAPRNVIIGALQDGATITLFDNCEFSFVTMGLGLTDSEALALHNIQLAFNTALGR